MRPRGFSPWGSPARALNCIHDLVGLVRVGRELVGRNSNTVQDAMLLHEILQPRRHVNRQRWANGKQAILGGAALRKPLADDRIGQCWICV